MSTQRHTRAITDLAAIHEPAANARPVQLGDELIFVLDTTDPTQEAKGSYFGFAGELRSNVWARLDALFAWIEEVLDNYGDLDIIFF